MYDAQIHDYMYLKIIRIIYFLISLKKGEIKHGEKICKFNNLAKFS